MIEESMKIIKLNISGMHCSACSSTIEKIYKNFQVLKISKLIPLAEEQRLVTMKHRFQKPK